MNPFNWNFYKSVPTRHSRHLPIRSFSYLYWGCWNSGLRKSYQNQRNGKFWSPSLLYHSAIQKIKGQKIGISFFGLKQKRNRLTLTLYLIIQVPHIYIFTLKNKSFLQTENTIQDAPDLNTLDKYVKITEAARILGFSSYQSVDQLIDRKVLKSYLLPGHARKRVLLSDLSELLLKNKKSSLSPEKSDSPSSMKRKLGRPRKFGI